MEAIASNSQSLHSAIADLLVMVITNESAIAHNQNFTIVTRYFCESHYRINQN
ncbi:hypothetical protein [Pseudanabaena sp. UWO311]|uniref:hypothetical protein n=1 Tax=Pseudanabaena sp. UWO311 TaxID=2487337 RepID=UPI0030D8B678